ncbi:MAG: DUF3300 domain-containing protein [Pseudolabrys sp.]|jgi:hypothetical protein
MSAWFCARKLSFAVALAIALAGTYWPVAVQAQQPSEQAPPQQQPQPQQPPQPPPEQQPAQQQPALTQQQVQQLVAPIALYPDALLAQVLTASTYPLEVTLAARWVEKNPSLKGSALESAMQQQPWDPSVKGMTSVAQVLAMMNEKLDWTNQLGEAFLAQPDDVQNAIQALRKQAEVTGNLKSSKEQKVSRVPAPTSGYAGPPEYIAIEPVEPDYIYVPVYDPVVVYGPTYWTPAYVPFFWHPPWWTVGPAFGFGAALFVGPALWYHYNWGHGGFAAIQTNTVLYSKFNKVNFSGGGQFQNWKFDPAHHGNVQFKNVKLQQQFGNQAGKNIQGIQGAKAIQGIQGTQGLQGKGVQGIQTNKEIQNIQGSQGLQKNKSVQGVKTNKNIAGVQTGNKNLQTGGGNKGARMVTSQQIHPVGPGGGGKRAKVQGGGGKPKNRGAH